MLKQTGKSLDTISLTAFLWAVQLKQTATEKFEKFHRDQKGGVVEFVILLLVAAILISLIYTFTREIYDAIEEAIRKILEALEGVSG